MLLQASAHLPPRHQRIRAVLSARSPVKPLADMPPVCSLVVSRSVVLLYIHPKSAIHGAASGALWGNLVMTGFGTPLEAVLVVAPASPDASSPSLMKPKDEKVHHGSIKA